MPTTYAIGLGKPRPGPTAQEPQDTLLEYDTELYKTGNIGERMFNRIKDRRQFSLRTVRCPKTFLPAAHIAETVIRFL